MEEVTFKDTMAQIPTNVSIVGSIEAGGIRACTISSLVSLEIDEPTIMFVLKKNSATLANLRRALSFSINVLNSSQSNLSIQYSNSRVEVETLNCTDSWSKHLSGVPILIDAHLIFLCEYVSTLESVNASIVFAKVIEVSKGKSNKPLIYFDRKYTELIATKSNLD
jgi:flavin reductase (DIM6/NTAB) family NADH-FMN oxidoreductase RutF